MCTFIRSGRCPQTWKKTPIPACVFVSFICFIFVNTFLLLILHPAPHHHAVHQARHSSRGWKLHCHSTHCDAGIPSCCGFYWRGPGWPEETTGASKRHWNSSNARGNYGFKQSQRWWWCFTGGFWRFSSSHWRYKFMQPSQVCMRPRNKLTPQEQFVLQTWQPLPDQTNLQRVHIKQCSFCTDNLCMETGTNLTMAEQVLDVSQVLLLNVRCNKNRSRFLHNMSQNKNINFHEQRKSAKLLWANELSVQRRCTNHSILIMQAVHIHVATDNIELNSQHDNHQTTAVHCHNGACKACTYMIQRMLRNKCKSPSKQTRNLTDETHLLRIFRFSIFQACLQAWKTNISRCET